MPPAVSIFFSDTVLTHSLVPGMEEFCERGGGALTLDHLGAFFVGGQLAEDSGCHPLDILNFIVQQLDENGNNREALN